MKISHYRARSFKAIEELEAEPKNINLVTGRNNTGKTSLLESIDLAFNPSHIDNYGENVNKIINVHSSSSLIDCEFERSQQKLSSFSDSSNSSTKNQELSIRLPTDEEASQYFLETLRDVLEFNEGHPVSSFVLARIPDQDAPDDSNIGGEEYTSELITDSLQESIADLDEDSIISNVRDNCVVMETTGEEYPYVYLGDYYTEMRDTIVNRAVDKFYEQVPTINADDINHSQMQRSFSEFLIPRFGKGRFVYDEPPETAGVKFAQPNVNIDKEVDTSQENVAIRISDIEQYLQNNNIAENLQDFSFSKLVFQEDGEKYEIPYSFMGDGFKIIVSVLWEMFDENRRGDVLLIEEAETHMHPGYVDNIVSELIKITKNRNMQVFITTHNSDFIESFFSKSVQNSYNEYLQEQFRLLQLTDPLPRSYNYSQAEENIKELNLDLRGI